MSHASINIHAAEPPQQPQDGPSAVPIRRFPTRLHVRCGRCLHQGHVVAFLDKPLKLKCTKCGNRNPIVTSRDRTRVWAGQRLGRVGESK
jgi:ribosomal protein S27E